MRNGVKMQDLSIYEAGIGISGWHQHRRLLATCFHASCGLLSLSYGRMLLYISSRVLFCQQSDW